MRVVSYSALCRDLGTYLDKTWEDAESVMATSKSIGIAMPYTAHIEATIASRRRNITA